MVCSFVFVLISLVSVYLGILRKGVREVVLTWWDLVGV